MPAGHVLVVVVGALLIGLLLNAGALRDTAARQEAGWQRSLALAVTDPIWELANVLRLTAPRSAIDLALGRDPAGPQPVQPTTTTTTTTTTTPGEVPQTTSTTSTTLPGPRTPTAADPLRVLIAGDSMVGQFGPMLERRLEQTGVAAAEVVFEFSSGLTRDDYLDWPARLGEETAASDPEAVVLFFGGNDAQAMPIGGEWIEFGSDEWVAEYRRRVAEVMDDLTAEGRRVYWMGMPVVSSPSFQQKVDLLNSIYRSEASDRKSVTYVDTHALFTGPDGGYSEYLTDAEGNLVDMRLDDGIHFTTAGGIRAAEAVFELMDGRWDLGNT